MKLYRVFAWIYRFYNNLKNKTSKSDICLKPFITAAEQTFAELFWIGQNQKQFSDVRLKTLSKDLILIYDENNLIRCEGRLKHAPLPYETNTPYVLNSEHYLSELIVKHLHTKLKHISIKQTLTELKQKMVMSRQKLCSEVSKKLFFM